eukprot:6976108-Prymnesium_polylepis.1
MLIAVHICRPNLVSIANVGRERHARAQTEGTRVGARTERGKARAACLGLGGMSHDPQARPRGGMWRRQLRQ